jgi:hypothetical protein
MSKFAEFDLADLQDTQHYAAAVALVEQMSRAGCKSHFFVCEDGELTMTISMKPASDRDKDRLVALYQHASDRLMLRAAEIVGLPQ